MLNLVFPNSLKIFFIELNLLKFSCDLLNNSKIIKTNL